MRRRLASLAALLAFALIALPSGSAHADTSYINSVIPGNAPTTGGVSITLFGTGFSAGSTVYFGTTASPSVEVVNSTIMSVAVPPGTGTVNITVRNTDGTTSAGYPFTYTGSAGGTSGLSITGVTPTIGLTSGGTAVTITGTGFVAPVILTFGGVAALTTTVVSSTTISAVAPPGATGAAVIVLGSGSEATLYNGFSFGVNIGSSVSVTSVAPSVVPIGGGGTTVAIYGTGFAAGATVSFGGILATNPIVYSTTYITAVAPAGPSGSVPIIVTNPGGVVAVYSGFAYGAPTTTTTSTGTPSITSISPSSGTAAGGTQVTISGSGFGAGAAVTFGNIAATNVNVLSPTMITAIAPPNSTGAVTVTVNGAGGQFGGITAGFTYLVAIPQVTGVSPSSGLPQGGTPISISGSGFTPGAAVMVGGVPASGVSIVSASQVNATTPPGSVGAAIVLVINPGGAISGLANAFSYSTSAPVVAPISIASVSPSSGPVAGGTTVTISGAGFTSGATVLFGSTIATSTFVSATLITAVAPPATGIGTVAVSVTNPGSAGSATQQGAFSYTTSSAAPPPTSGGNATGPLVPAGGSGLFVFRGGSNADLLTVSGCNASTAVFWTTDSRGAWIGYLPSVPVAIVNAAWNALFPNGIPANTPIFARCG